MSLDVYLEVERLEVEEKPTSEGAIFVRMDGQNKRVSRAEWDRLFPGREPITITVSESSVYHDNITHNLSKMAEEAGIYKHLWRPDRIGIETAGQLIESLRGGLIVLESDPARFKKFNPANGWGDYEGLVSFVRRYLVACKGFPHAEVRASR